LFIVVSPYRRRPPPPPPPRLAEPRELDERAELPLYPPPPLREDPPNALLLPPLRPLPPTSRLPARLPLLLPPKFPPPAPLLRLLALGLAPPRLAPPALRSPPPLRCWLWAWRLCAPACRDEAESPRADPPYLLAVALSL